MYFYVLSGHLNSIDRGTWWATVHGVTKNRTELKRLSKHSMPYWGKCLFRSSAHFLIGLLILSCLSCLRSLEINPLSVALFAFSSILWDVFSFCLFPLLCKAFKFSQVPSVYFCLYFHCSRKWNQKDMANIYVREFCLFSSIL